MNNPKKTYYLIDKKLNYYLSLMTGDEKHEPSSISTLDVIYVLYNDILNISPNSTDDMRDRFYLSKGMNLWRSTQYWRFLIKSVKLLTF